MHIRIVPSFFLTNSTLASQGDELGRRKHLSNSSWSCFINSFISQGAKWYADLATGLAPGLKSILNFICRSGGRPDNSSRNTSKESGVAMAVVL
ncbi:hypothetical protein HanOQP8_Chr11g0427021 [Helianthus annuus]|nr:hypothetical protein HanOQP8_Chr11g0427021 [Helianthus annuus]